MLNSQIIRISQIVKVIYGRNEARTGWRALDLLWKSGTQAKKVNPLYLFLDDHLPAAGEGDQQQQAPKAITLLISAGA